MSKLASMANLSHFQQMLECFRSKMDPFNGFWAERLFPHGFGTIRAYIGPVLVIYIIFIISCPPPKMAILREFNAMFKEFQLEWQEGLNQRLFVSNNNLSTQIRRIRMPRRKKCVFLC